MNQSLFNPRGKILVKMEVIRDNFSAGKEGWDGNLNTSSYLN